MKTKLKVSILIILLAVFTVVIVIPHTKAENGEHMWGKKVENTLFPGLHTCSCPHKTATDCSCIVHADKPKQDPNPSPGN